MIPLAPSSAAASAEPGSARRPSGDLARLQALSRRLSRACDLLLILLPLSAPLYWGLASPAALAMHVNLPPEAVQQPPQAWQRALGALLAELPLACLGMGLWRVRGCLQGFAQAQIFTAQAVRGLRGFAAWSLRAVVCDQLVASASSVLLTLRNAPGTRQLVLTLSSDLLLGMVFASIVWVLAEVIVQGQALADENATFL